MRQVPSVGRNQDSPRPMRERAGQGGVEDGCKQAAVLEKDACPLCHRAGVSGRQARGQRRLPDPKIAEEITTRPGQQGQVRHGTRRAAGVKAPCPEYKSTRCTAGARVDNGLYREGHRVGDGDTEDKSPSHMLTENSSQSGGEREGRWTPG